MPKLKSTYKILSDYNLILEHHQGILEVDSLIKFKKIIAKDSEFKPNMRNYINYKNVVFSLSLIDIQKFVSFIKSSSSIFGKRKIALLTSTPKQVVTTTIYKNLQEGLNQEVEIFSTSNSALNWLKNNESTRELKSIISTFEENF